MRMFSRLRKNLRQKHYGVQAKLGAIGLETMVEIDHKIEGQLLGVRRDRSKLWRDFLNRQWLVVFNH